jgi:hypothetical protein
MQAQQDTTVTMLQHEMAGKEIASYEKLEEMTELVASRLREAGERQEQTERAALQKQEHALEALEQCNMQQRKLLLDGVHSSFTETHAQLESVLGSVTSQYQRLLDERCDMMTQTSSSHEDAGEQILMSMDNSHSRRLLLAVMLTVGQMLSKAKVESASMIQWLEAHALGIASTDPHLSGTDDPTPASGRDSSGNGAPTLRGFPGSPVYAAHTPDSTHSKSLSKDQLKAQARSQLLTFYSNRIGNEIRQMKERKHKHVQEQSMHGEEASDHAGAFRESSSAGAGAGAVLSGGSNSPSNSSSDSSVSSSGGKPFEHRRHLTPHEQDQRHDERNSQPSSPAKGPSTHQGVELKDFSLGS